MEKEGKWRGKEGERRGTDDAIPLISDFLATPMVTDKLRDALCHNHGIVNNGGRSV